MQLLTIVFLFLGFSIINQFSQSGTPPEFDPEQGLVAYYSFDHCNASEETGNSDDGIMYGDPGCHCGVNDDGLFMDGVEDYLEFPGTVNRYFGTTDFTVSYYIKPLKTSIKPF